MTRLLCLLLSIVAAGGLASAALAKEGGKPRPGAAPAQSGNQPGPNGQDMTITPPRIAGEVQEGTYIRHCQQPARTGQSPAAGRLQEGSSVRAPRERPRRRRR